MHRYALVVVIISALTSTAVFADAAADKTAPTTQGSNERRGEAVERFKSAMEQLNLTDPQKEKIKTIMEEAKTKLKAAKAAGDDKSQMREIIQKLRQDIMGVLDAAQKEKLQQILKEDRAKAGAKDTAA